MSVKLKKKTLKKRDFLFYCIEIRNMLVKKYGYKIKPVLKESVLPEHAMMSYSHRNGKHYIIYDYAKFSKKYGNYNPEEIMLMVSSFMAHEFRHFYQHRQIYGEVKVCEKKKTIDRWIKDEIKFHTTNYPATIKEYFSQPQEIDAFLFQYVFCAQVFEKVPVFCVYNKKHYADMKNLYKSYFGKVDKGLFNRQIKKLIPNR